MEEVLEEQYTYIYILTPIKYIYGLLQEAHFWFKEYIKIMTLKVGFKQWNVDPCLLYRVEELWIVVVIVYVYFMLEIGDKP